MKKVHSKKSHLLLSLHNDTLFVWSLSRYELYGFERVEAALFFYMEEFFKEGEEEKIYLQFGSVFEKNTLKELIKYISSILNDEPIHNIKKESGEDAFDERLDKKESFKYSFYIELNSDIFKIESQNKTIYETIYSAFSHLITDVKKAGFIVSIKEFEKGYKIYADKELVKIVDDIYHLLPYVYSQVRLTHYKAHPFLIAIHAAALFKEDRAFIFPGISGAGKSTISAYLMHKGYTLLSDELCVLHSKGSVSSLPLNLTLKEGSWDILEPFVKDIKNIRTHLRFDGIKIKYITPVYIQKEKVNPKKLIFVFPTYKKESSFEFEPISITEALRLLKDTGYHLFDPTDFKCVYEWLSLLSEAKLYKMRYSDLKDVYDKTEKLLYKR